MKIPASTSFLHRLLAAFLLLTWVATAQEKTTTSSTEATGSSAPAIQSNSTATTDSATDKTSTAAPAAPTADAPPAAPSSAAEEPPLRHLDTPSAPEAPSAAAAEPAPTTPETSPADTQSKEDRRSRRRHSSGHGDERVSFGHSSTLAAGESAQSVVSIFGSSSSAGTVHDAVVSVLGSSTSSGEVGNAVVSVLGSSTVTGGSVGDAVVSVIGTTRVNGKVHGDVVAVLGNVELGPDADVGGEITCVGGTVKRDPAAVVRGKVNNVAFGTNFEGIHGGMEWLQAWVTQCVFLARPLAFGPHLMWAWWIAIAFLGFYALLALIFPGAMEKCATTLEQRPGYSILTAVLVTLLSPIVIVLLCITVVGIAIVPFLGAALIIATLFGKAVMLTWIGRSITKHLNTGAPVHAALSTLVGGVILLLLYCVPVLGFVLYKVLALLGLGVVVYTLILGTKRKAPVAPVAPAASEGISSATVPPSGFTFSPAGSASAGFGSPTPDAVFAAEPRAGASVPPSIPPVMPASAATLVRAGFWIRIAASLIDCLIVAVAMHLLPRVVAPNFMFAFAVYAVILWALKGTTVGGIVCNLKVVRIDDRPMDWPTALVRALGGFLSFIAAGLGFIWVAFDDQKQSWHDKIAGTTIVQVPRGGVSLV